MQIIHKKVLKKLFGTSRLEYAVKLSFYLTTLDEHVRSSKIIGR
jgi:hypothetical protein